MAITIRSVTPEDARAWVRMREQLGAEWVIPGFERKIERFFETGLIDHLPHAVFVAEDDGRPIGLAEVSLRQFAEGCETSPVGFLEGWFVEASHRGRGVGRALVDAGILWARSKGCTEFASDAETRNTGSQNAHESIGFEKVCEVVCYRRAID
ncbi:MAG: GNAT family N-acetyltransferase [Phycisphaerales bacterium JB059]